MRGLLIALVAALLQAPAAPGSIEGVVLGPGGRPVAGAEVSAPVVPAQFAVRPEKSVSDASGRFTIRNLAPGTYRIVVVASGYARQEYGASVSGRRGIETGTLITVAAGRPVIRGIELRLTGDAVVSGRITSTNGQALVGMEVRALLKIYDATGNVVFAPDGESVRTNDRGEYRIAGLTPGHYYVRANTARLEYSRTPGVLGSDRFNGDPAPLDRSPGQYGDSYYPGVADRDKAAVLDIQAGSERRNVDFSLPRLAVYRIRGRIANPLSIQMSGQGVFTVVPTTSDVVLLPDMSTVSIGPDGTFELKNVSTGDYWVNVSVQSATPGAGPAGRGYARARVVDADVDGVEITLLRDVVLSGSVQIEGEPASNVQELASTKIEMRGDFVPGQVGPPLGKMKMLPDGTFTYTGLPIMEFRLVVSDMPRGFYVKEARFGDVNALTEAMQMNHFPPPALNILLARGTEVSGLVTDSGGRPVSQQQVVLVPDRALNRPDLYRTAVTDSNGRFTISAVAPGDYQAFAWRTLEPFRYFDRDFVQQFESRATSFRIDSASPVAIAVKLIP